METRERKLTSQGDSHVEAQAHSYSRDRGRLAPGCRTAALGADSFTGKVTDVSDGDTLVIGNGGRVRVVQLAGIDAPELAPGVRQGRARLREGV